MKKSLLILAGSCLFLWLPFPAAAQNAHNPPKILQIFREEIKAGRGAAHERLETGYVRALQKANWPSYSLAATAISGPPEAWFLTGYDSFEAMEKDRLNIEKNTALISEFDRLDEQDSEFRTGQRAIVASFREDLSYQPSVDLPQMRYFEVITIRVRPGHDAELVEAAKLVRGGFEKANRGNHYAIYQAVTGTPSGTYLVFVPIKSLKEIDAAIDPKSQLSLAGAMGEENFKKFQKLSSDAIIVTESRIYSFSPKMSYVSKEFAAGSADFWNPKRMVAGKAAAPKKTAAKTAEKKP